MGKKILLLQTAASGQGFRWDSEASRGGQVGQSGHMPLQAPDGILVQSLDWEPLRGAWAIICLINIY